MRRSLAPHAAERMVRIEQREQLNEQLALIEQQLQQHLAALEAEQSICIARESTPTMESATFISGLGGAYFAARPAPADTALLQRAARAERQARTWYRLAIALAVGCAVLLLIR